MPVTKAAIKKAVAKKPAAKDKEVADVADKANAAIEKPAHLDSPDCWCKPKVIGLPSSQGKVTHYIHRRK